MLARLKSNLHLGVSQAEGFAFLDLLRQLLDLLVVHATDLLLLLLLLRCLQLVEFLGELFELSVRLLHLLDLLHLRCLLTEIPRGLFTILH